MERKTRYGLLDALRGFSMISMVLYHAMYDLVAIYGFDVWWYFKLPGQIWQQSICCTFIFLSGMCFGFSRSPLKNGIRVSLCGLVISLVTFIVMPSQVVIMGVLSLLGASTLIMIPFSRLLDKRPRISLLAMSVLFVLTREINSGYISVFNAVICPVPQVFFSLPLGFAAGFVPSGFYSSDYFSLMPWFFLFAAGHCFWNVMREKEWFSIILQREIPILSRLGRHSLAVYMFHQPVIMAFCMLFLG